MIVVELDKLGTCSRQGAHVLWCDVVLIGYGVVAGFNVGDEKPPHD
jgi:hypothetical protein